MAADRVQARRALVAQRRVVVGAEYPDAHPEDVRVAVTEDHMWRPGVPAHQGWHAYLDRMAERGRTKVHPGG